MKKHWLQQILDWIRKFVDFFNKPEPSKSSTSRSVSISTTPTLSPFFKFFGLEKFLVFASYFDVMNAMSILKDMNFLKSHGINGVRIYLNWSNPKVWPWTFLFQPDGSLEPGRLRQLHTFLQVTASLEMVVDIASSRRLDGIDGKPNSFQMAPGVYAHCWRLLAREIKKWGFTHILGDGENEANGIWAGRPAMTVSEAKILVSALHVDLPTMPVTISVASHITPEEAVDMAVRERLDWLGFHDRRDPNSVKNTEAFALRCLRALPIGSGMKVGFDEPCQIGWNDYVKTGADLMAMLLGAEKAGIAFWCMHSNASFELKHSSYEFRLLPPEKVFYDILKTR